MKTRSIIFGFILCGAALIDVSAQSTSLKVNVTGIDEVKGNVLIGLFDQEDQFLKNASHRRMVKVDGNSMEVTFENLPAGDYAISIIHDENENGELDSNFLGMPKEGFGFGNNAMGMFGPPSFKDAKVKVGSSATSVTVKLRYL